jgi:hypothetical protein
MEATKKKLKIGARIKSRTAIIEVKSFKGKRKGQKRNSAGSKSVRGVSPDCGADEPSGEAPLSDERSSSCMECGPTALCRWN